MILLLGVEFHFDGIIHIKTTNIFKAFRYLQFYGIVRVVSQI